MQQSHGLLAIAKLLVVFVTMINFRLPLVLSCVTRFLGTWCNSETLQLPLARFVIYGLGWISLSEKLRVEVYTWFLVKLLL